MGSHNVVGATPGDLSEGLEDLVRAVSCGAKCQVDPAAGGRQAMSNIEQRLETSLVVREVEDDGRRPGLDGQGVDVHPAGVEVRVRREGPQPLDDSGALNADGQGR